MTLLTVMEYLYHKWPYVPLVEHTSRYFPHPWLITGFVTKLTWRVPLVVQELRTIPEHLISTPDFSGVRVTQFLVLCVCFVDRCFSFVLFLLTIVLSVLLRFTDSDYPFGIFKLLLWKSYVPIGCVFLHIVRTEMFGSFMFQSYFNHKCLGSSNIHIFFLVSNTDFPPSLFNENIFA